MTIAGLDTRLLYLGVIAVVIGQRLVELWRARRNTRRALAAGAIEVGKSHYPIMVIMHAAFLIAGPTEVWLFDRPFVPAVAALSMAALVAAGLVRVWVLRTLGDRWTTRIVCFPGRPVTRSGPYRYLRHPNYLAVAVEIVALPMVHTAVATAILFSLANGVLLRHRIRVEERALAEHSGYGEVFG